MPELGRCTIEAIDRVVDEKMANAEWDPDAMRSALIDVHRGVDQEDAVEDRDFSQATLSNRLGDVRDVEQEMERELEDSPSLFRDPMDDAVESFRGFFEDLNDNYDMGIKEVAIRMMVDEIRDAQQLPAPNYISNFLNTANSGVANDQEIRYITRRYEQWLNNFREQMRQQGNTLPVGGEGGGVGSPGGGIGGPRIGDNGGRAGGQSGGGAPPIGGGQSPRKARGRQQDQRRGRDQRAETDPKVERLEQQVGELKRMLADDDDDGSPGTITVEQDDGSKITIPADDPRAQKLFEDDDDEDILDQMAKMKEAGLIVTPDQLNQDDEGEELASKISEAIESLGQHQMQAQQQMSANFKEVLDSLTEAKEDDDDLTMEDVEEVLDQKLTKSEVERVREEMDERYSELHEELKRSRRRSGTAEEDPEFLKKDREMEYQEKQLETINENLQRLPEVMAKSVREAVPAMKELQMSPGGGSMLWSPPGQGQRGQPRYNPEGATGQQATTARQQTTERNGSPAGDRQPGAQAQTSGAEQAGYPDSGQSGPEAESTDDNQMAQREPRGVSEDDAASVRAKLGLDDTTPAQEAEA